MDYIKSKSASEITKTERKNNMVCFSENQLLRMSTNAKTSQHLIGRNTL